MKRSEARARISRELGNRRLIWLGISGEDARGLAVVPQLSHSYSVHSSYEAEGVEAVSVESLTGQRHFDYDIAVFLGAQGRPLVESFTRAISEPAVLVSYSPYAFIDYILGTSGAGYLGNPYATFQAVSDKPTVEAALGDMGVSTIPWMLLPENGQRMNNLRARLRKGPVVLRSSKQDGGAGHELIEDGQQVVASKLARLREPISVAPYLDEHVPLCIGACVFPDGGITLHPPSFQLVGIKACSRYDFGYCGNDFGAVKGLDDQALETVERCVRAAGDWLHGQGFVGAFGVDVLVRDDEAVFVEINPRFQGSSSMSAELDEVMDRPDVYMDHLMACLGLPSYASPPLAEQARSQASRSQLHCLNLREGAVGLRADGMDLPEGVSATLLPKPGIRVGAGSLLFTLQVEGSVTENGKNIGPAAAAAVRAGLAAFEACA